MTKPPKNKRGDSNKDETTIPVVGTADDEDYDQPLLEPLTPDGKKMKTGLPLTLTTAVGGKSDTVGSPLTENITLPLPHKYL